MTIKATLSSKNQVTIPAEARRKLGIKKNIIFDIRDDELVIRREPTLEDLRALLNETSDSTVDIEMSDLEKSMADQAVASDRKTRGC